MFARVCALARVKSSAVIYREIFRKNDVFPQSYDYMSGSIGERDRLMFPQQFRVFQTFSSVTTTLWKVEKGFFMCYIKIKAQKIFIISIKLC